METDLSLVTSDEMVEELGRRFEQLCVIGVTDRSDDEMATFGRWQASNVYTLLGALASMEHSIVRGVRKRQRKSPE